MRRIHADLLLLACAAIWGFAFLFQKTAMVHIGPMLFVAARGFVAALVLAPLAIVEHRRAGTPVPGSIPVMSGLAGGVFLAGAIVQQTGIQTASVMNTGFLTALYVVATPFVAFALMRRPIATPVWLAVGLSFAGTWLLGGGTLGGLGAGDWLVALSSVFWATHVVVLGLAAPLGRPVLLSALQFLVVGTVAFIAALLFEPVSLAGLRAAATEIAFVGVLSSALTFTILAVALRATTPAEASIIVASETVFAAFGAWLVLGERLSPISALGAGLILAAVLTVQLGAARPPAPP